MAPQYIGELTPIYDNHQSFYGKARVYRRDKVIVLVSYTTEVMRYDTISHNLTRLVGQPESATTNRHMREFARQLAFEDMNKKALCKLDTFSDGAQFDGNFHASTNPYYGFSWLTPDINC